MHLLMYLRDCTGSAAASFGTFSGAAARAVGSITTYRAGASNVFTCALLSNQQARATLCNQRSSFRGLQLAAIGCILAGRAVAAKLAAAGPAPACGPSNLLLSTFEVQALLRSLALTFMLPSISGLDASAASTPEQSQRSIGVLASQQCLCCLRPLLAT